MEILSYIDSKSSFLMPNVSATLEEMLHGQKKRQKKQRHQNEQKFIHRSAVSTKAFSFDASVVDTLYSYVIKARYVLLSVSALLLLALGVVSITSYVQSFATPLEFQEIVLVEEELLTSSMHSFVSLYGSSEVYEEEALALLASGQSTQLYTQPVSFSTYTVQQGDSIHTISNKFGLDNISTLIGINEIDNVRLLWAGQKIKVPSMDGLMYTVKSGDSLEAIAKQYSVTIEEILDVNELDSINLYEGEILFVPGATMDSTSLKQALGELFIHPLSVRWRISSYYGYRADPFTGVRSFHTGTDFAVPKGTPVRSAMSGTVSTAGYSSIYGYYVIVNHGNGYQTLYAHFMEAAPVKKGQNVNQSSIIGYVGSTGYSTGNHLHFSVYKNGKLVNPNTVINY